MKPKSFFWVCIVVGSVGQLPSPVVVTAQSGGDQFLDGIGETGLVARYVFHGNERDASRNAFHATLQGTGGTYVDDPQFGRVLLLPGEKGAYVQIPGQALDGLDTISVSAWVQLRSDERGQRLFDFGQSAISNFFCVPVESNGEGLHVGITQGGLAGARSISGPLIPTNRWVHIAVVLDSANKRMACYINGNRIPETLAVAMSLDKILHQENAAMNLAFIGRAQDDNIPTLNALVHDFRIYSVALTDRQVATIHDNAIGGSASPTVVAERSGQTNQPANSSRGIAQPMADKLVGVADVKVETTIGTLPRLPATVWGIYHTNTYGTMVSVGPEVRVIWPSPTNTAQVAQPGTYSIIGTVVGTSFQPKATVTVKANAPETPLPKRRLEAFPLGSIALNRDEQGRDTQFIKNRDKFIRTLATTNPDRFLYNFRDAFGQPQPEGTRPLSGWDSETTRLRGHASGHYLSAIAQAYASTTLRRSAAHELSRQDELRD